MSKIDLNKGIIDIEGNIIITNNPNPNEEAEYLTIRKILINCLLHKSQGEEIDADESLRRYQVAKELMNQEEYEFLEKDRSVVVKNITKIYSTLVVGQVMEIL